MNTRQIFKVTTCKPNKTRKKINLAVFMGHKISMSRGLKAKTTEQFNLAVWNKFVTQSSKHSQDYLPEANL